MSEQTITVAEIDGCAIALLVSDIKASSEFYKRLGFNYAEIGGPKVKHLHVGRGKITFILHPAVNKEDVRPASSV